VVIFRSGSLIHRLDRAVVYENCHPNSPFHRDHRAYLCLPALVHAGESASAAGADSGRSENRCAFSAVTVGSNLLDGRIAGRVPGESVREDALSAVDSAMPAGRLFDHLEVVRPRIKPRKVTVSGTGGGLLLTGSVGEESFKSALAAALAPVVTDRSIKNELLVSERVREPDWAATAEPLLAWFFQRIPAGTIELGRVSSSCGAG